MSSFLKHFGLHRQPPHHQIPNFPSTHISQQLPPKIANITFVGDTISNLPHIYRDGGGGGTLQGRHLALFSDGLYTTGGDPKPDNSNVVNFTSNSLACFDYNDKGVQHLLDFGTSEKGPKQQVPYFESNGENGFATGVWPNQNIAIICNGTMGVSFPQVVNRTAIRNNEEGGSLYNTGVEIKFPPSYSKDVEPVVSRPVQALFKHGEPGFGTFCALADNKDGYLYLFAQVSKTTRSNGLKMARVKQEAWSDRSRYEYWNGRSWGIQMPALDDGGFANVFNYSQEAFGVHYGPGTGEVFFSTYYGVYMLIFTSDAPALDQNGEYPPAHENDYLLLFKY